MRAYRQPKTDPIELANVFLCFVGVPLAIIAGLLWHIAS